MKSKIKQAYKNWAPSYDDYPSNISLIVERSILMKIVKPQKKDVILDAGCGTGRYIGELKKRCKKVVGVDFSEDMLALAKKKHPNIMFYQRDLTKRLPFRNNTFNKIISSLVFSHFKDISKPLKEMYRLLKKNGKLFITDFAWHQTIDWKSIKHRQQPKYKLDVMRTATIRPIAEYVDKATLAGFEIKGIIPLRVPLIAKKYLTAKSYKKNKGKWGSVIYILEKN